MYTTTVSPLIQDSADTDLTSPKKKSEPRHTVSADELPHSHLLSATSTCKEDVIQLAQMPQLIDLKKEHPHTSIEHGESSTQFRSLEHRSYLQSQEPTLTPLILPSSHHEDLASESLASPSHAQMTTISLPNEGEEKLEASESNYFPPHLTVPETASQQPLTSQAAISDDEGFCSLGRSLSHSPTHSNCTSFSAVILSQASKVMPANLYMIAKHEYATEREGDLRVRRGQEIRVLYQEEEDVFGITRKKESGYLPVSLCHISSKYLNDPSKRSTVCGQYQYSPYRPKGQPLMHDTANTKFDASSPTELSVSAGDRLSALMWDDTWVYVVSTKGTAGFIPRTHCQILGRQDAAADQSGLFQSPPRVTPNSTTCTPPKPGYSQRKTGNVEATREVYSCFRNEVLDKATPQNPANLHMVCIQDYGASHMDEVSIQKGQKLVAMLRNGERVLIQTRDMQGYIHQSVCHLSSQYTKSPTKRATVSRRRLSPNPTGVTLAVVTQAHTAMDQLELTVQQRQQVTILFCDSQWAYCVVSRTQSGFLPRPIVCMLSREQAQRKKRENILYVTHNSVPGSSPLLKAGQKVYEILRSEFLVYVRTKEKRKLWVPASSCQWTEARLLQPNKKKNNQTSCDKGSFSTTSLDTIGSFSLCLTR